MFFFVLFFIFDIKNKFKKMRSTQFLSKRFLRGKPDCRMQKIHICQSFCYTDWFHYVNRVITAIEMNFPLYNITTGVHHFRYTNRRRNQGERNATMWLIEFR